MNYLIIILFLCILYFMIKYFYLEIRKNKKFENSEKYWEERYLHGGNSGAGAYGKLSKFKAKIINNFIIEMNIREVIEYGCGDGNQLKLSNYKHYIGFDVSQKAISLCQKNLKMTLQKNLNYQINIIMKKQN